MMKKKLLKISDINIAYYDTAEDKPSIVFVHGNSHSAQSFKDQFASDLTRDFRIVAIDLAGHGDSEKPSNQEFYSIPYHAYILLSFVKELKLESSFFAGHSLGGHIILEASAELSQARGIMIWGAPPLGNPPEMGKCFLPNPDVMGFFGGELTEEEAIKMCKSMYADGYENYKQFLNDLLKTDPMARLSVATSIQKLNFADELFIMANLKCPFAILHGEHEKVVDRKYFDQMDLSQVWKAGVVEIPGAGHSPHVEAVDFFNKTLRSFCEDSMTMSLPKPFKKNEHLMIMSHS